MSWFDRALLQPGPKPGVHLPKLHMGTLDARRWQLGTWRGTSMEKQSKQGVVR